MTTPASNTPYAIIVDALRDAGKLSLGQVPSGELVSDCMRRIADTINYEQTQGLKLWVNVDTEVPLVALQQTYTLGPGGSVDMVKPMRIIQGYYLNDNPYPTRRPLTPLSWNDWLTLGQTASPGAINSYFENKQQNYIEVKFWLPPDAEAATGTAHLLLQCQVTNPVNLTETMNFPQEWRMFLRWALADEKATGQPQAIMDRCAQRAQMYREALENWDVEDAPTQFTPDTRNQYSTYNFR